MARFVLMLAISTMLWLVAVALFPITGLLRPNDNVVWAASLYQDKERIAANTGGTRIFAVGGSGTLFSLDTVELSGRLGRPVINYGSHAGLGLPYILDRASRVIKAGDLVLLTPEHELLQETAEPSQLTIAMVAFYDRPYLYTIPWKERLRFLLGYDVLSSVVGRLKFSVNGYRGRNDIHIDSLGNERGNSVEAAREITLLVPSPVDPARPVSADARSTLARFASVIREKKAQLIVLPPALLRLPGYASPSYHAFKNQELAVFASLGLDTLGGFDTGFLTRDEMYDTVYHANDRGRARYTAEVENLICGRLACEK